MMMEDDDVSEKVFGALRVAGIELVCCWGQVRMVGRTGARVQKRWGTP
jgi:hypothetical protein